LAVLVTSNAFPSYALNLDTGEPVSNATQMVSAQETIYHDATQPSVLRFRVLTPNRERYKADSKPAGTFVRTAICRC